MKPQSLATKLYALVGLFAALLIAFGAFAFYTRNRVQIGSENYSRIILGKDLVADILPPPAYILEAYLLTWQAANAEDAAERARLLDNLAGAERDFQDRQKYWREALPASRMKDALVVDSAAPAAEFFQLVHERFVPAVKSGDLAAARSLAGHELHDAYVRHRKYIDEVVTLATQFSDEKEKDASAVVHRATVFELVSCSAMIALGVAFSTVMIRGLTKTLRRLTTTLSEASAQVTAAAEHVSSSSQTLADGSSEQAASLEETSASLEELAATTKHNSESAIAAKKLSNETRTAAETGNTDMGEMRQAMEAIKTSSNDISKIIKSIDEIAFQTNILALNAAVEAARAGEAGAGFAVVAEEVRNLARRAADSAKETAAKIEVAIQNGDHGVIVSGKVADSLAVIVAKASRVDEYVGEIAAASQEQTQGLSQISTAVNQMDQVTQANAGSAEETAAAAEEMNSQAVMLRESVAELGQLIGHAGSAAIHRKPAAPRATNIPPPPDTALAKPGDAAPSSRSKTLIEWDVATMHTGVESVDAQHRELIEMINRLHVAFQEERGHDEIRSLIAFLTDYVRRHFKHEEELMERHRCPSKAKNLAAHKKFLREFSELADKFNRSQVNTKLLFDLRQLVGDWLKGHICSVDTQLRQCPGLAGRPTESPAPADHADFFAQ